MLCFLTLRFGPLISEGWRLEPHDSPCLGSNQLGSQSLGLKKVKILLKTFVLALCNQCHMSTYPKEVNFKINPKKLNNSARFRDPETEFNFKMSQKKIK